MDGPMGQRALARLDRAAREDGEPDRIERAMAAVLATFGKLDIAAIERAADGGS